MTSERTDAGAPADVRLDRRVGSWTTGFHGVVAHSDLPELAGVSFRDVALGRRTLGSGRLEALTDLPSNQAPRVEPTRGHGGRHVGRNGSSGPADRGALGEQVTAPGGDLLVAERSTTESPAARTGDDSSGAATTPPAGSGAAVDLGEIDPTATGEVPSAPGTDADLDALATARSGTDGELVDDGDTERYLEHRLEEAAWVFLPNRSRTYAAAKRALDLVGACLLLVVALPVMAVLAVIIKIDSPGPALFRQDRVTHGGRHFRFYKFRTMYVDAKERFPDLYAYSFTDSTFDDAFYKLADDPRNTRFGAWLRRTTLDELPNLFNVVLGDLSLVGPRPELPELVRYYRPEELACFFTKAGLTGLAQVAGRSLLTVRERLTLDLRYVSHQTLLLDLRILWRTVIVVVARKGAFSMAPSAAVVEAAPDFGADGDERAVADVLVAIVSFHCRDDVVACVESVRRATAGLRIDLVVADNGSVDGTVATLADHPAGVRVLDLGRNTGFAHASNRAIESGPSRSILLLNPDTTVEPGAIETLATWLDEHPNAGVVAPRLVNPDGSDQQTARAFPTPAAAIFGRRSPLTRLFPRNRWSTRFLTGRDHRGDDPFAVDWVSGAALMVPRSVADEVGLLDEGYFLFWEDADWCRRIKDAGYEVWCVPTATVVHHEGGTRGHGWATPVVRHFHAGAYRYWRLHHAPQPWNPLRWGAAVALGAHATAIVARERIRSTVEARRSRPAGAVPSPTHRSDQNR